VQLPLLMAKSRHRSLRTVQRYARPGPIAVAALTAARLARRADGVAAEASPDSEPRTAGFRCDVPHGSDTP
jgi:hypothetical protein